MWQYYSVGGPRRASLSGRVRDTFAKVGDCRPVSRVEEMVVSSLLAGLVGVLR
jgi:hypothetical protein